MSYNSFHIIIFEKISLILTTEDWYLSWKLQSNKLFCATILVIIFWHFLIISLRSESPQVKRYLISSITNLLHEFPHELPNNLRPRILGNWEILDKFQMSMEKQPSTHSSFQKLNVDNNCQKTRKIRYYIFETLSNFTVFL